jgi:hypothetical protein
MRLKDALGGILGQPAGTCKPCQVFLFLDRMIVHELARVCLGYQPQIAQLSWHYPHLESNKGSGAFSRRETQKFFLLLKVIAGAQEVPL